MSQTETSVAAGAAAINDTIQYTMWSVFAASRLPNDRGRLSAELEAFFAGLEAKGVTVRGVYDLSGLRADADLMVWWHAASVELLQTAYKDLLRTDLGQCLRPVWSNVGLHRPAEFNKGHVPAFMSGEEPRAYLCVYPFVRSYEWYLLPEDERSAMLAQHGRRGAVFTDVIANTVSTFALSDYEWLLPLESDELISLVDLMRDLRATDARRHVREEVPFYTGRRIDAAEIVEVLQ